MILQLTPMISRLALQLTVLRGGDSSGNNVHLAESIGVCISGEGSASGAPVGNHARSSAIGPRIAPRDDLV